MGHFQLRIFQFNLPVKTNSSKVNLQVYIANKDLPYRNQVTKRKRGHYVLNHARRL